MSGKEKEDDYDVSLKEKSSFNSGFSSIDILMSGNQKQVSTSDKLNINPLGNNNGSVGTDVYVPSEDLYTPDPSLFQKTEEKNDNLYNQLNPTPYANNFLQQQKQQEQNLPQIQHLQHQEQQNNQLQQLQQQLHQQHLQNQLLQQKLQNSPQLNPQFQHSPQLNPQFQHSPQLNPQFQNQSPLMNQQYPSFNSQYGYPSMPQVPNHQIGYGSGSHPQLNQYNSMPQTNSPQFNQQYPPQYQNFN